MLDQTYIYYRSKMVRQRYMHGRPAHLYVRDSPKAPSPPRFASVQVGCCGQRLFNSLRGLPPGETTGRNTEVPQGSTLGRNDLMDVTMNESLNASVLRESRYGQAGCPTRLNMDQLPVNIGLPFKV